LYKRSAPFAIGIETNRDFKGGNRSKRREADQKLLQEATERTEKARQKRDGSLVLQKITKVTKEGLEGGFYRRKQRKQFTEGNEEDQAVQSAASLFSRLRFIRSVPVNQPSSQFFVSFVTFCKS
jgi:hypothetical protein